MDQFVLVLLPGVALFLTGLIYGVIYAVREGRASVRAAQLRLIGLALMLGLPAVYLTYLIVAGRAYPVALVAVAMMVAFAGFNIYLARGLRVPPDQS